jgi:hypothetical protein
MTKKRTTVQNVDVTDHVHAYPAAQPGPRRPRMTELDRCPAINPTGNRNQCEHERDHPGHHTASEADGTTYWATRDEVLRMHTKIAKVAPENVQGLLPPQD